MILYRTPLTALVLAAALSLSSCSSVPLAEVSAALAKTSPCCATYADINTFPLEINKRLATTIDTSSKAFASPVGFTYFAAFQLPAASRTIDFQAMHGDFLRLATFTDPIFVFLDREKRPLKEVRQPTLATGRHKLFPGLYEYYFGAVLEVPSESAYVVVFAHPKSERTYRTYSENGTPWDIPASPVGSFALIAK